MAHAQCSTRMKKELQRLRTDPPHGVSCWPKDGRIDMLEAKLIGAEGTPYEGGIFKLEIKIPNRYPFEPPQVQFQTKIYHPNIDSAGRICLDVLKSAPTGSWKPSNNIHSILTSIQLLLSEPNPDDGLMADIALEFKKNKPLFVINAKKWVEQYAKESSAVVMDHSELTLVNDTSVEACSSLSEDRKTRKRNLSSSSNSNLEIHVQTTAKQHCPETRS